MLKTFLLLVVLLLLSACSEKPANTLNGKKLLEQKCARCHNIDLPPTFSEDEKAPPMMAVAFHIKGFMDTSNESQRVPKAIEFVKDYVINPSESKSFCDKESMLRYGLMPSQKGLVKEDELEAITDYMFKHFTQENLTKKQADLNRLAAMPKGKRLAIKYKCLGCHRIDKNIIGPSFNSIALQHKNSKQSIRNSILNGSQNRYKESKGVRMPAFSHLSEEEVNELMKFCFSL